MTNSKQQGDEPQSSVRKDAFVRLMRIEGEGSFIGLDDEDSVGGRSSRQTLEYVAGITRWKRRLDFLLARFYRGEFGEMELKLKVVLRIGLYDLLYLDTPEYAAVNEAVALAKSEVRRGAGGLTNGILRSILRNRDALPEPDTGDEADDLAVAHSHPTWMIRRWLKRYGRERTEALLTWNNARPSFGVRINSLKTDRAAFVHRLDEIEAEWEDGRYLSDFLRMPSVQPLLEHRFLQDGLCGVQDESAGLIVQLLDPQPGESVIDLCAAPGGKSMFAAQRMQNQGRLTAVDLHEGRLRLVRRSAAEHEATIVETVQADAREYARPEPADRVLVDAPCSGFGVLSKRADLRWRRSPEDLTELAELQDAILDAAAQLVRRNGVLVYGTCTIEPEENERRVEAFLERHPEFSMVHAGDWLPTPLVTDAGYYASFPPDDQIDGAFAARLERRG